MRRLYILFPDAETGGLCGQAALALEPALVVTDVPSERVEQITERVRKADPKVEPDGIEPCVAALP